MTVEAPDGVDLKEWELWDEKSKAKFLTQLEAAMDGDRQVWYCKRGRTCDGMPHEGADYGHARADQWPPSGKDWLVWLLRGGRGSGKTRSGAEWTRKMSEGIQRISIIGPTLPHVRDVMVEGDSGLLAVFDLAKTPVLWESSKRRLTIPCKCKKGKKHHRGDEHYIQAFTGEEPERLRGPQHGAVWLDEPAHFPQIEAVWDNMIFGLRLGLHPVIACTTTPLPTKWMKNLIAQDDTVSVTVSTYANLANLAPTVKKTMLEKYEGTRLGRQELYGEILDDIQGALWTWPLIEDNRAKPLMLKEDMDRIVVAIDPAGTSSKKRDETGIIVVGRKGNDFYLLADASGHYTPDGWATAAWKAFDDWDADRVVAEKNYGGEMVSSTLTNNRPGGPVSLVHSRRGKKLRAEPIVALYEQQRFHHNGIFDEVETQLTEWVPDLGDSPDRIDALVHGATDLSNGGGPASVAIPKSHNSPKSGLRGRSVAVHGGTGRIR